MNTYTIEDYRPEFRIYFEKLNKAWLEEFFVVEPIDKWVLENPEEAIVEQGGRIIFVTVGEAVVGTVALKKIDQDEVAFELTKMAVDKSWQGKGLGNGLCKAAIATARDMGAHRLILYSQTSLAAAINIYRKLGFKEVSLEKGKYARADIKMELDLRG